MSILTTGILGEQYIGIQAGAEEDLLKDGDNIWLTSSAVVLENLVSELLFSTAGKSD
jgi:phospholipid/cholesterol/gamma-HCH transport system substrate-binding protein